MFDLTRFARLVAATWAENARQWAWFLGVLVMLHFVLVMILVAGGEGYKDLNTNGQGATFLAGLFLSAPIFAARYFQALTRPGSALLALMRPASVFEKWLLAVLVVAVAYPLAFHVVFYLCDIPGWLIAGVQAEHAQAIALAKGEEAALGGWNADTDGLFSVFTHNESLLVAALMIGTLQAFAMLGSLVFRSTPFLKTMLVAFVMLLVAILLANVLDGDMDTFFDYWDGEAFRAPVQRWLYPLAWFAIPGLLWFATFVALREREVA